VVKRKILIVINNLDSGGTEYHLLQVLPRLCQQLSCEIYIYTIDGRGRLAPQFENQGIKVISLRSNKTNNGFYHAWSYCRSFFLLKRTIKKIQPDVIHCFLTKAYIFTAMANFFQRRPLIMSRRSLNFYQSKHFVLSKVERFMHRFLLFALGNSKAVVNQLITEGIPERKVRLIYNGVDTEKYHHDNLVAKQKKSLSLIIVANLRAYKGHLDLLSALTIIANRLPKDWQLICAGRNDGMLNVLKAKASELHLGKHIHWVGECENISGKLKRSDIMIACSHEEGFSNSILEGMSASLPIIATDVGGNSEAVTDNQTGFIVPVKSPKLLSEAILTLATSDELRKKFGQAGRLRVEKYFSIEACVINYKYFYEEVFRLIDKT